MDSYEDLDMLLYRRIPLYNYRGNGGGNGMEESAVNNGAEPSADYISDMEARYSSSAKGKGRPVLPSLHYDRPLQSVPSSPRSVPGRLSPVRSFAANVGTQVLDRYSGRTLLQQEFRASSLDLASPESPLVRGKPHVRQGSHDICSGFSENHARKGHKSHSDVKSLDSVILQPSSPRPSLPTVSSPNTDSAKQVSAKQCTPSENHIHPLFRSGSASPPPTPAPGTVVTASPVAGQTISARMVGHMKSSPSIQASEERSRSPLTESVASVEDAQEPESPSYNYMLPILGANSQRSVSRQGREYDLNESPFES
ncbi:hypothetical protein PHISP_05656 [Aspergillus sp. HF37]|nr:hypothetical protein PHISP_05656 [Aspergillus sp. HF37]